MKEFFEHVAELNGEAMTMDGFDKAVVGYVYGAAIEPLIVYDRERVLEILMEDGLSYDEAWEFFGFNQESAYVGEGTPVFLVRPEEV